MRTVEKFPRRQFRNPDNEVSQRSQWLFEDPLASEIHPSSNPYVSPEYFNPGWEDEWELQEANLYGLGEDKWKQPPASSPRRQTIRETISGFSQYSDAIPPQERGKISRIAQMIVRSYRSGQPIRTVQLVGHADRDVQRGSSFEKRISAERARQIRKALIKAIERLSKPLEALPPISIRMKWLIVPAGATQLVVPKPVNEAQRSRNRRVEIYLSSARSAISPRLNSRSINREASDPKGLTPKLQALISRFLSNIGEKVIDRMNCFNAVTEAGRRLSEKAPRKSNCQLNYTGWELVESKQNDHPLSKSVVCYPWTPDFYAICKNEKYKKRYGHCSGIDGRYVVLKYKPLTKVIANLKDALDRGCLVRAGVLSGLCDDKPDIGCAKKLAGKELVWRDCPEHWLLIIGYDGDKFLFWDSAQMSNISRGEHVFGLLHYNSSENRLTTAPVDPNQDTMVVTPRPNAAWDNGAGWHVFDLEQKRYQVLSLHFAGSF